MTDRALVRNAADPEQVKTGRRREQLAAERRVNAYRAVLATADGRFVFWDLLSSAGVFRSIWHASAAIHYNSGRQDFGHELMATLIAADEDGYDLMQREARTLKKLDDRVTEAAQTPPADKGAES